MYSKLARFILPSSTSKQRLSLHSSTEVDRRRTKFKGTSLFLVINPYFIITFKIIERHRINYSFWKGKLVYLQAKLFEVDRQKSVPLYIKRRYWKHKEFYVSWYILSNIIVISLIEAHINLNLSDISTARSLSPPIFSGLILNKATEPPIQILYKSYISVVTT